MYALLHFFFFIRPPYSGHAVISQNAIKPKFKSSYRKYL